MSCENNPRDCACTYPCPRRGKCCECVAYHQKNRELPACYFSKEAEATYNRSIEFYLSQE
jgi:hypothetical protein